MAMSKRTNRRRVASTSHRSGRRTTRKAARHMSAKSSVTRGRSRRTTVTRRKRQSMGPKGTFSVKVQGVKSPVQSAWYFGG